MLSRRALLAGLSVTLLPFEARAAWPERAITLLHGFAPGGGTDTTARIIAEGLSKVLGQTIIVETKPGAGTTLAGAQLARATPDGYTISMITATYAASSAFYKQLPYKPVGDLRGISLVSESPYMFCNSTESPIANLAQMIAAAKAGKSLSYGTPGVGSGPHLIVEQISQLAGVKFVHIPFRGGSQAVIDVLAGRVDFMVDPPISMTEQIKAGKFRALAVTTAQRFPGFEDVPTVAEAGFPGFAAPGWYGLVGPVGMPDAVVQRLHDATVAVLAQDGIKERLLALGSLGKSSSPTAITELLAADVKRWGDVLQKGNIERI
ncbi:tripartite tricarboxylate transporter substrate binding protein [Tardiphaga sp.]|jgi:tripartite-type tricarboxylate transporter receptor subunit TctC|uniref:Bug family tripartite tricarboxylate transporter substrate binding protein n=1 Tax=Tardiphaga sp. TaxID=1926292 RepID=UPI0025F97AA5|nr:tripartite tricarboxylate transporter substrate binding protein [Tardiphaga sp.]